MYTKATNCGTVGVEVVLFWLSDLCKSSQETIGAILVPSCIEAWTLHPSSPLERGAVRGAGSRHGGVHAAATARLSMYQDELDRVGSELLYERAVRHQLVAAVRSAFLSWRRRTEQVKPLVRAAIRLADSIAPATSPTKYRPLLRRAEAVLQPANQLSP